VAELLDGSLLQPANKTVTDKMMIAFFIKRNGEHEPREAAAADSRVHTDRTGCFPLAPCSGR
jgi:hypothetical protein